MGHLLFCSSVVLHGGKWPRLIGQITISFVFNVRVEKSTARRRTVGINKRGPASSTLLYTKTYLMTKLGG